MKTLREADPWVRDGQFMNRTHAIKLALSEIRARRKRGGLIKQLTRLNSAEEQTLAEESLSGGPPWPQY
jgi:Arc/MetJ-type ribon-helix-helix transcriptional regulator